MYLLKTIIISILTFSATFGGLIKSVEAETLFLKSGKVIHAPIISRSDDHIKVDLNGVILTFYKDEIQSIGFETSTLIHHDEKHDNPIKNIGALIEKVSKSVVVIEAQKNKTKVQGTGFFISEDGLVATNLHVVFKAKSITVRTKDGQSFPVEFIVNASEPLDICILKITIDRAPALTIGNSNQLKPGDILFTIGHREGSLYQTSSGPFVGFRTIDGDLNLQSKFISGHGNSGGPILTQDGKLIGISKAFSPEIGHNFGIPINQAKPFLTYNNPMTVKDFNQQISPGEELTYAGQGALLAGDILGALEYFEEAIKLEPQNLKAWVGAAKAYTQGGMLDKSLSAWQEVQRIDPDNSLSLIKMGKIYLDQNKFDQALLHLEKAAKIEPNSTEIYSDLGYLYGQKGMISQTIEAYGKAVKLVPSDALSHFNLSKAFFNARDFKHANAHCEIAKDLGYLIPQTYQTQLDQAKELPTLFKFE